MKMRFIEAALFGMLFCSPAWAGDLSALTSTQMDDRRVVISVPESEVKAANIWMRDNIDHEGGEYTFTVPYKDDKGALFYVCSFYPDDAMTAKIQEHFATKATKTVPVKMSAAAVSVDIGQ